MRGNPIIIYIYNGSFRVILSEENVHENIKILYLYLNINICSNLFNASFRVRLNPNLKKVFMKTLENIKNKNISCLNICVYEKFHC
jgi:hypothetical protein